MKTGGVMAKAVDSRESIGLKVVSLSKRGHESSLEAEEIPKIGRVQSLANPLAVSIKDFVGNHYKVIALQDSASAGPAASLLGHLLVMLDSQEKEVLDIVEKAEMFCSGSSSSPCLFRPSDYILQAQRRGLCLGGVRGVEGLGNRQELSHLKY
ncbi:hypothetical protein NDU88_005433 [Pleurodeles waltl]|uniref:Uncharacterized protein n=1 Tax=Pleurodeles waltl TaxID=8319 RepID=A0AAV7N061_PLEWA|nr:hypothetical protein NDU88_005433 [Pleurodeles waltl]